MKKDKEKVIDEVWTEDHVRSFLQFRAHDGSDTDFHMLLKAYQSMRASDFELFVQFFVGEGRNLDATGRDDLQRAADRQRASPRERIRGNPPQRRRQRLNPSTGRAAPGLC